MPFPTHCRRWLAFCASLAACQMAFCFAATVEEDQASPFRRTIENFSLRDPRGHVHSLDDARDSPWVVVAFLGTECPLARLYAPRLSQLCEAYLERGVAFYGIDSNRQDALAEIEQFARVHELPFPVLKDAGNTVADQFGAQRTPEVFVLDRDRVVRYHGRIDDQYGVGLHRSAATRRDLVEALDELLAGKAVTKPQTESAGCLIGRVREPDPKSDVTWSNQISRLFQRRCQECHRAGQIAPFPLLEYEEVAGWAETIREVVREQRMPPWHADPRYGKFANDARLTDEEKSLIERWVAAGAPLGDPAALPPPRVFTEGWQIPKPDKIVYVTDEPVAVPAEGVLDYHYYTVDPGFREGKWIQAAECRAGNRSIVHHMTVFVWLPGESWLDAFRNFLAGSAVGWGHMVFPPGTARYVPAGSKFVFVMHYTPNGASQTDRSYMGLVFANPSTVKHRCWTIIADNPTFQIPPRVDNYAIESSYTFDEDVVLLALTPHMHLRGKSFRYEAQYPGGEHEVLLDIPRYDFNWQAIYVLAEQKPLPRGTKIHCVAHYDNSAENPLNPDPEVTVGWGFQSWDEMMDGYLQVASVKEDAADAVLAHGRVAGRRRWLWTVLASAVLATVVAVPTVRHLVRRRPAVSTPGAQAAAPRGWPSASTAKRATAVPLGRWLAGSAALLALPLLVLVDTWLAQAGGWVAESPVAVSAAMAAAWGAVAVIVLANLPRAVRRLIAGHGTQAVLLAASLVAGVFVADRLLDLVHPRPTFHCRLPNSRYTFEPSAALFPGVSSPARVHHNSLGMRGDEMPPREAAYRVLCLGGSTTECLYLDDAKAWPQVLGGELRRLAPRPVWVGNTGISDFATGQHLRFVKGSPLVDQVDAIVVLVGANDLMRLIWGQDFGLSRAPLWYRTAAMELVREIWNVRLEKGVLLDPTGKTYMSWRRNPSLPPPREVDLDRALAGYQARLEALCAAAQRRGVRLIFASQSVLWQDDLSWAAKKRLTVAQVVPVRKEWELLTAARLRGAIDRYNETLADVCRRYHVELIDLAATMNGQQAFFYDDYHANDEGCAEIARLLAPAIAEKIDGPRNPRAAPPQPK